MPLLIGALVLVSMPREAAADIPGDRVDFGMYGRAGVAWTRSGQIIQGQTMNLTGTSIGGRFEEGDYLEPTLKFHVLKGDKEEDTDIDVVFTLGMFPKNGAFISALSSNASEVLGVEVFQAFVEARDVFVRDLGFWAGARFYRGADVHIADYYYFNALNGQGAGLKYKGLDTAVILQTSGGGNPLYNFDTEDEGEEPDIQRQRTVFVAQYTHPLGLRSTSVQGLAEAHVLPAPSKGRGPELAEGDFGWAVGAKLHLDLDNGSFNDVSVRFGSRLANGAGSTFYTWGAPGEDGSYDGAYGLEVVDHFLWNFGRTLGLNAYGILRMNKGASDEPEDKGLDFAVGARANVYAHDKFHLVNELTFQGAKYGENDMGTAVKFTVAPTLVPNGDRSVWARPHLRLIYTTGFYNDAAADQLMSPYLRAFGRTKTAHYFGTRAEWWF